MRLNIRTKLIASFLTVLFITGLIGFLGIKQASQINNNTSEIGMNWMKKAELMGGLDAYNSKYRIWVVAYVFAASRGDQTTANEDEPKIEEAIKSFESNLSQVEVLVRTDQGRKMMGDIKTSWKDLKTVDRQVVTLVKSGKYTEAVALMQGDSREKYNTSEKNINDFITYNSQLAGKVVADSENTYNSGRNLNIFFIIIGIVIGIGLALYISGGISKSVKQVAQTAARMSEGDLTVQNLNVRSKDEIGEMGLAFNRMLKNLRNLISETNEAIQGVTSTSEELSATSGQNSAAAHQIAKAIEELAKGNTEQTKIVSEAVDIVEQLTKSIESVAGGAQEQAHHVTITTEQVGTVAKRIQDMAVRTEGVRDSSELNYQAAQKGETAVNMAIEVMKRIELAVKDSGDKITELGNQSQQIGEIIQVIDDIAEQTNLLALNAAIEAARAGEHGKGFAVVADEVRKLAERSGKATKEIAVLITNIQTGTEAAVKSMDLGTREVTQGVETAQGAGEALNEILKIVERTGSEVEAIAQAINEISASTDGVSQAAENVAAITEENTAATEEMAAGSGQVNTSIMNIAAIAQESAAAAEEVSASAEEMNASTEEIAASAESLTKMAEGLQKIVAHFQV